MAEIRKGLDAAGCDVPLVADVHFNPNAAFRPRRTCEKVRINPGNFVDAARTFKNLNSPMRNMPRRLKRFATHLCRFLMSARRTPQPCVSE